MRDKTEKESEWIEYFMKMMGYSRYRTFGELSDDQDISPELYEENLDLKTYIDKL